MIPFPFGLGTRWPGPTVDLAAVGDVMLGRWVGREIDTHGRDYPLSKAKQELGKSDIAIGNLECALSKLAFSGRKRFHLQAKPAIGQALQSGGFAALSLANNHALDCGPDGLAETTSALRMSGVATIGITENPTVMIRKGLRIAFLAYCDFPNDSGGPGVSYTNETRLQNDITVARRQADVVVVYWHWGDELSRKVSNRQRLLAKRAANAGVDLVLGAHPHVLQPIEWIQGNGGKMCLVAYSLGNFVFDAPDAATSHSEILHVTLSKRGVTGFRVSPYVIVRCRPEPTSSPKLSRAPSAHVLPRVIAPR